MSAFEELPEPSGERSTGTAGHRADPCEGVATPSQSEDSASPARATRKVGRLMCGVYRHPSNMVNVYDGEHYCQECRWGL